MELEKANEILFGEESANHLQDSGTLISNPDFLLELSVDGEIVREKEPYGVSRRVTDDHLDYIVHRLKNVTLSDQKDYYEEHEVEVTVYSRDEGEVKTTTFEATPSGWEKK